MAFPKFHGLQLAANSWIENLNVEQLAVDPALVRAGQLWLNTAEGVLKYSALDGATLVALSIYDKASAQAAIAALQSSIDTVSSEQTAALVAETAARISALDAVTLAIQAESVIRAAAIADAALTAANNLATEVSARTAADATLAAVVADNASIAAAALGQEVVDRDAAIAVASSTAADQLATETSARLSGDAALDGRVDAVQAELNATQAGAGLGVDGAFVAPVGSAFLDSATSLANAQALLDAALAAEAATRAGTDTALASAIANEAQLRLDGDTALEDRITAYVNGELLADATQDAAEVQQRIDGDAALQAEIDRTQAAIGLDTDGNLIPIVGTNYLDPATTVFGGAAILDIELARVDASLTGEIAGRAAAIAQVTADLQAEALVREQADTAQQQEINAIEAGAGLEADGTYAAPTGSNYLNESTSLKDADFKLDAGLKAASDRVGTLESVTVPALQTSVTAEQTRALAAEAELLASIQAAQNGGSAATTELKNAINAGRFTFKSVAPALSHTVTHNLNSEFVQYTIMVEGEDLVYRNDIVPVAEINGNSFSITLTEARNVKVSVLNAAALA